MRNSSWRWVVCGLVVTVVAVAWMSRRRTNSAVVGHDEFLSTLSFVRHEDGQPINDLIELEKEAGIYVDVSFIPHEVLPQEFGNEPIQDPSVWPFVVRIYPRTDVDAKNAVELRVEPYRSRVIVVESVLKKAVAGSIPQGPVTRGTTGFWQENRGFHGPPSLSKGATRPKREIRLWTFLSPDPVSSGEHVFELAMYPTARFLSKSRFRSGDPVILCRGIIRLKG